MDHVDWSSPLARRLRRGELIGVDCALATAYTLVLVLVPGIGPDGGLPLWARCSLAAGIGLPGAVRRIWPLPVFVVVVTLTAVSVAAGLANEPFLATAFALYLVALTAPRRMWLPTLGIAACSAGLVLLEVVLGRPGWQPSAPGWFLAGFAVMGVAWTLGRTARERRAYAARAAEASTERAVGEERLRIARELHDIVAHSIGVIAVKAGVARVVAQRAGQRGGVGSGDQAGEQVCSALCTIEATSRSALEEMRRMLDVLRSDGDAPQPPDELAPTPGLADLPELVDRVGVVGVRARLEVRGVAELPQGVGLSVYRIVQEALTNVVKHAAPARCRVIVHGSDREVLVEVTDDGHAAGPGRGGAPGGHGLIGMRERVALYGGEFSSGWLPGGGFRVTARLPCAPEHRPAREWS